MSLTTWGGQKKKTVQENDFSVIAKAAATQTRMDLIGIWGFSDTNQSCKKEI